ncbi:MAG: CrcB family protein [Pseudomonadota bacterium]
MVGFWFSLSLAAILGVGFRSFFLTQWGSPWGTLLVNVLGSLLIGYFAFALKESTLKTALLVGFLGALTTFSSYSLDLIKLFHQGQWSRAGIYFLLSNILCLSACYTGWRISTFLK